VRLFYQEHALQPRKVVVIKKPTYHSLRGLADTRLVEFVLGKESKLVSLQAINTTTSAKRLRE
jgi:hypothetical protein